LSSSSLKSQTRAAAAEWVARRNNGEHSAQEQRAFMAWLNASDDHRRAYAEAEALWDRLRHLDEVAASQLAQARRQMVRHHPSRVWRRAALVAMLFLGIGVLWMSDWHSHLNDATYVTALGQRRSIDLSDGSRIELNTNSEVAVHYSRSGREIRLLRGQAVFTVAQDHDRPFDVFAGGGRIRDISTQFEVRRWSDRVSVAVLDGEVELLLPADRPGVRVRRGQGTAFGRQGDLFPVQSIDINTYASWREGKVVFHDRPLEEVLSELARYQSGSITVGATRLAQVKVSGSFSTDNLPQALQTVAAALPARLTQTGPQAWRLDPR